ncbi:receptor-like cytosolic serine/threonine-protein kinase RBK2 isoform X2 [Humulus lupulus]|uniref:receptor-like cytosolic serine/threonine-protein kinase RBK2 isoform X2 n=1 Tax=Humulus lupulus TaxID=3486 RepID=UPI002B40795E|nr:receptor-like cytosolic serine/threonine-protein kinase RBK2 isoform X2 [Humulus lupulus]
MTEKEDTCSPTGVLEDYFRSSDSETYSCKEPNNESESHKNSKLSSRWHGLIQLMRTRSKKPLNTMHPLNILNLSRRMSGSMREIIASKFGSESDYGLKSPWKNFSLYELQVATNYFRQENLIGKGGYAEVYKGCLRNGQLVAIKKLTRGKPEDATADFLSEIGIMAHVNHPNTAKLIGYGVEGGMHLVLELSPHGSLASMLYGSKEKLKWGIRYKIALGTARGLVYLHQSCQRRIIHRDIKATNILLSEDFEAQICDFGLAKWLPEQWTHHTVSKFEGTFGYLAPEYLLHGIVDEKTDVFAYGVLLLELVTGRRALDYSNQSLVLWAKPLLKKSESRELIDPSLADDYNSRQVLELLHGDFSCLTNMKKTRISFFQKASREELTNTEGQKTQPVIG